MTRQTFEQRQVDLLWRYLQRSEDIRNILGAAGEDLHGDEVLNADELYFRAQERSRPDPPEHIFGHSADADQKIHAIPEFVLDINDATDGVARITAREHGLQTVFFESR